MSLAELGNLIIGICIIIGGTAMGLRKAGLFNSEGKSRSKVGNGRRELASKESKREIAELSKGTDDSIKELWKDKQDVTMCDERYKGLKEDTKEIKDEQVYLKKLMVNVAIKVQAEIPR